MIPSRAVFSLFLAFAGVLPAWGPAQEAVRPPEGFELAATISVPGNVAWTDSGLEVAAGEELYFEATGTVSLQRENPIAECGPEGLKFGTMQQPLTDRNLGCLLGRVVVRVEVFEDRETKEKTTREYGEVFAIGSAVLAAMPADGRLTFGVNENVVGDNAGAFLVTVFRRKA
ncbi:MAG: hypothetical protein FJY82_02835 [Candidatus Aminicenantes bacterium]|nr:hypothetical protein [Candidatus Aminicenantes bacterium]